MNRRPEQKNAESKTPKSAVSHSMRVRAIVVTCFFAVGCFGVLIARLVDLQLINSEFYRNKATNQQLRDEAITPHRGVIYDTNMNVLAQSANVWTVTVSPRDMKQAGTKIEDVANKLAELLEMDAASILEKLQKDTSNYQLIKRKIEEPVADAITAWIKEYNAVKENESKPVKGISLVQDSKRYYPYGTLASTVIGFTNVDGDGLTGLELYYNETLKGTPGRIVAAKNAWGYDMPNGDYEAKYDAVDGNSLVLTINENIQASLDKYLLEAVNEHNVTQRGVGIAMDPQTGAILAMSVMPCADLNDPYTLYDQVLAEQIAAIEDSEARTTALQNARNAQWRNKAVQDIYEPGSVFKIVTAAMALDCGAAGLDTTYSCAGGLQVGPHYMRCAQTSGHGSLNFYGGLDNSCNPYFIHLGQSIGAERFCHYLQAFGFTEKTGIDMQNEGRSQTYGVENMGLVELSSSSFGQSSTVTPIAMLTAACAAVNGGKLMQPYVVKQILDANGNILQNTEPVVKRQVVSEETSKTVASLLGTSVYEPLGHGHKAYISGYKVGGKSGTSQKLNNADTEARIASFLGFAPANDPKIAVLVLLDEPHSPTGSSYGGRLAAPVVRNVLTDAMPYLGVEPQYTDEELATVDLTVPTATDRTPSEAQTLLSEKGFNSKVIGSGTTVSYQYPAGGTKLARQSTVILYTNGDDAGDLVVVPDVVGKTVSVAQAMLKNINLNIEIIGASEDTGMLIAENQSIEPGTEVELGTVISVAFYNTTTVD